MHLECTAWPTRLVCLGGDAFLCRAPSAHSLAVTVSITDVQSLLVRCECPVGSGDFYFSRWDMGRNVMS